jgi:hypothetical protein
VQSRVIALVYYKGVSVIVSSLQCGNSGLHLFHSNLPKYFTFSLILLKEKKTRHLYNLSLSLSLSLSFSLFSLSFSVRSCQNLFSISPSLSFSLSSLSLSLPLSPSLSLSHYLILSLSSLDRVPRLLSLLVLFFHGTSSPAAHNTFLLMFFRDRLILHFCTFSRA